MPKYTTGVLSGGMARGLYQLGVLMYQEEQGFLTEVTKMQGCSVGAIISFYLVAGLRPMQCFRKVFNMNVEFTIADVDVLNTGSHWGLLNIEKLLEYVAIGVKELFDDPFEVTFSQLYSMTGKTLVIVVTNLSTYKPDRISHLNHPNMKVMKAIGMSANLPILFTKNEYEDTYYIDGGISDNFPISDIDDGETLCFGVDTTAGNLQLNNPQNLMEYIYRVSIVPMFNTVKREYSEKADIIRVSERLEDLKYIFSVPQLEKWSMFSHGYKTAKRYYNEKEIGEY